MRGLAVAVLVANVLAMDGLSTSATAQYDRDGRYVPSPMGVPRDPDARPIPGYSGKPGAAIGNPYEPPLPPAPPLAPLLPRVGPNPPSGSAPLSLATCEDGYERRLRMSRAEFESRCRRLARKRQP